MEFPFSQHIHTIHVFPQDWGFATVANKKKKYKARCSPHKVLLTTMSQTAMAHVFMMPLQFLSHSELFFFLLIKKLKWKQKFKDCTYYATGIWISRVWQPWARKVFGPVGGVVTCTTEPVLHCLSLFFILWTCMSFYTLQKNCTGYYYCKVIKVSISSCLM